MKGFTALSESREPTRPVPEGSGPGRLEADCGRCFGLCCVAPGFSVSADFAIDKPAGQPCPNLRPGFRCGIHDDLRPRGFRGCAVYDCFGAGQHVSQVTFAGRDWRQAPHSARQMFEVFAVVRQLHELLWYLSEALASRLARPLHGELRLAIEATERRTRVPGPKASHAGADLAGARLKGASLRGASLREACLIGADLSGADLRAADLAGADLRDADLSGADLTGSIFLVQSQLDAAHGDARTRLPRSRTRPAHW